MYESPQRIRFNDVDGAGIVYYPRFFHLCHNAFEEFFTAVAPYSYPTLINQHRRGFPTVHVEGDFKRPLRYGDVAVVELGVMQVGTRSARFRYRMRRQGEVDVAFEAHVVTAFMDLDSGKAVVLDDDIKAALNKHLIDADDR
jgi:4-hydroxybenzoyl-CoA thioesterase